MKIYWDLLFWVFMIIFVVLAIVYAGFGCTDIVYPEPGPADDADCPAAEQHLEELGCDDLLAIPGDDGDAGTADDPTWLEFCRWVQASGMDTLDLGCVLEAPDCDAVEICLDGE